MYTLQHTKADFIYLRVDHLTCLNYLDLDTELNIFYCDVCTEYQMAAIKIEKRKLQLSSKLVEEVTTK